MQKQKIITFIIIISVVAIFIFLFFYGKNANAPLSVVDDEDKTLVILDKGKIEGNKDDLVSFSILPDTRVSGILSYRGSIKGAYFFEGNILINILDLDKKVLKASNGIAKSDWMTVDEVDFEGNIDFSNLPKGPAYFEIKNDNPGAPDEGVTKRVLIPIIIE
jgi:hypothetical protein